MPRIARACSAVLGLWLLVAGALFADIPEGAFVKREGSRLALNGQSFYFSGANQYYLFYKSHAMIDEVLEDAARMGLTVIRTWAFCDGERQDGFAFQPSPRVYDETTFRNLDYAVYKASTLGIRLILTLVNNWDAFGGMNAYVRWSPTARSHDDFYSDPETKALYRDYLDYILWRTNWYTKRRYRDEPAILMWELANEPRIDRLRERQLHSWIDEMAGFIKSNDPNHLVSSGSEGDIASDFVQTHQSPHIDVASFHLYPEDWGFSDARTLEYIRAQTDAAHKKLGKPLYCGELGRRDRGTRDAAYTNWYKEFDRLGIDGANFWLLSGHQDDGSLYPDYDGFTVYYPESKSTVAVIENFTKGLQTKSARPLDLVAPAVAAAPLPAKVSGRVRIQGQAQDDQQLAAVSVNFGGGQRPAQGLESWVYDWDTTTMVDGTYQIAVQATDREGNQALDTIRVQVANGTSGLWELSGERSQDDGFNLVYTLSATNRTSQPIEGHFVFRYFLTIEGALDFGTHYENSDVFQGDPKVSAPQAYCSDVSFVDIDMGQRRVEPMASIGYKGQMSQADGRLRSFDDWSSADIPELRGSVRRVQVLKDGKPIAGFSP